MKTFDEVKRGLAIEFANNVERQEKIVSTNDNRNGQAEKSIASRVAKHFQHSLDNIDEATIIEIGFAANELLKEIDRAYLMDINLFRTNFDLFVEEYILGSLDGTKRPLVGAERACNLLGISLEELRTFFKGKKPRTIEVKNAFIQAVNSCMGTGIPLMGVIDDLSESYENAPDNPGIFVAMKEAQQKAGILKNGPYGYDFLADNTKYKQAKESLQTEHTI